MNSIKTIPDNKYIAEKIISTYENSLENVDKSHQLHWFIRRYRITGDDKYKNIVLENYKHKLSEVAPMLKRLNNVSDAQKIGWEIISLMKPSNSRKAKRIPFYKSNPQLFVYMEILNFLFITKSLKLDEDGIVEELYKKGLKFFMTNNVSNHLLTEDLISTDPSGAANMVYYLKYLGVSDIERELLEKYKKHYLNMQPEDSDEWLDKVYAFTHLIIAASNYYQNFVNGDKFKWIYDYFEKDVSQIIRETSPDAVTEVGVCFRLSRDFDSLALKEIKKYLATIFDNSKGYIPREIKDTLNRAEHRNILAVMLFSEFTELFPGPNLSSS